MCTDNSPDTHSSDALRPVITFLVLILIKISLIGNVLRNPIKRLFSEFWKSTTNVMNF